jgi:hypothetical protein
MAQRSIIGAFKTGSISRSEARNAVRSAASGQSQHRTAERLAAGSLPVGAMSARVRERYLGHFGSGSAKVVTSPPGTRKALAKKAGVRKSAKKSAGKKAGARKVAKGASAKKVGRKAS